MNKYYIENIGCDATTDLVIELTDEELEVFIKICKELNKKSTYGCMPTISIYKFSECEVHNDVFGGCSIYTEKAKDLIKDDEV